MSILSDAIAKYGGADEAYKNKLKTHIRNAMGFSNYVSQSDAAYNRPLDLSRMKGNITPQGVKSLVGGAMDINNQEGSGFAKIAGQIDSTAEGLAAAQISDAKARASKKASAMGFENGVAFAPQNELEERILAYEQNPTNPDGSIKSLQQFEAEMVEYFKENPNASMMQVDLSGNNLTGELRDKLTQDEIKATIQKRVPSDFIGKEDKYSLMAQGFSSKQADEYAGAYRYNEMSEPEKLIYQTKNPEMAKRIETLGTNKDLLQDVGMKTDPETGEQIPRYSFNELKQKYPDVPETTIKEMTRPFEQKSLQSDIQIWYQKNKSAVIEKQKDGYANFMKTPEYDEFKTKLQMEYGGVFTQQEIDQMIYYIIKS